MSINSGGRAWAKETGCKVATARAASAPHMITGASLIGVPEREL